MMKLEKLFLEVKEDYNLTDEEMEQLAKRSYNDLEEKALELGQNWQTMETKKYHILELLVTNIKRYLPRLQVEVEDLKDNSDIEKITYIKDNYFSDLYLNLPIEVFFDITALAEEINMYLDDLYNNEIINDYIYNNIDYNLIYKNTFTGEITKII